MAEDMRWKEWTADVVRLDEKLRDELEAFWYAYGYLEGNKTIADLITISFLPALMEADSKDEEDLPYAVRLAETFAAYHRDNESCDYVSQAFTAWLSNILREG